ncbi:MAG: hypothetical protein SGILL_008618, partial [Bacillariaceae sp.]
AQGIGGELTAAMSSNAPHLAMTYAEFPLQSFDVMMDAAMQYIPNDRGVIEMVDIGSGLGRIVFYTALSRGTQQQQWHVHGVEISNLLHQQALLLAQEGVERDIFGVQPNKGQNVLSLHEGRIQDHQDSILSKTDLVFAYSTAFNAKNFDPEIGALLLDAEWSQLLGDACPHGCVAITTDRALDRRYGWKLLERIDVENKEVFGSTGYIQVLQKGI